jgi:hypothetical protein
VSALFPLFAPPALALLERQRGGVPPFCLTGYVHIYPAGRSVCSLIAPLRQVVRSLSRGRCASRLGSENSATAASARENFLEFPNGSAALPLRLARVITPSLTFQASCRRRLPLLFASREVSGAALASQRPLCTDKVAA